MDETEVDDLFLEESVVTESPVEENEQGEVSAKNVNVELVEKLPLVKLEGDVSKFPDDYMILIRYGDYSRKTLIEAVQEELSRITSGGEVQQEKLSNFLSWLCRMLNMDMSSFYDAAHMKRELELAQQNIDDMFSERSVEIIEDGFDEEAIIETTS